MIRSVFLSALALLLAISGNVNAAVPKTFVKQSLLHKELSVRGGAGPLDATTAAKIAGAIGLTQGVSQALAPTANLELYGSSKPVNPLTVHMIRRIGLFLLIPSIFAYCLLFKNYSMNTAFALGALIWIVETLHTLLNDAPSKIGYSKVGDVVILLISSATFFSTSNNLDWAPTAMKVQAGLVLGSGLSCSISSNFAARLWEIKNTDNFSKPLLSIFGLNMLGAGVAAATLAWDKGDVVKAMGNWALTLLVLGIKFDFITKEIDLMENISNISKALGYFWMVIMAGLAASILL